MSHGLTFGNGAKDTNNRGGKPPQFIKGGFTMKEKIKVYRTSPIKYHKGLLLGYYADGYYYLCKNDPKTRVNVSIGYVNWSDIGLTPAGIFVLPQTTESGHKVNHASIWGCDATFKFYEFVEN